MIDHGRIGAGGDKERRARVDRPVGLFLGEHGAGADEQIAPLGQAADRFLRRIGAESDLGDRQAARHERIAKAVGVGRIIHHDHRHESQAAELIEHLVHVDTICDD